MTFSSHDSTRAMLSDQAQYRKATQDNAEAFIAALNSFPIGTRVIHRRYAWMIGTVTLDGDRGRVYVAWDCERYWNANDVLEDISDIRPTPHQPTKGLTVAKP